MAILNISLPDQMKEYIEERISQGGYSTTSEYFRDLVRDDQKRNTQERLEALLLQGIESGSPIEVTEEYLRLKRDELLTRIKEGAKSAR